MIFGTWLSLKGTAFLAAHHSESDAPHTTGDMDMLHVHITVAKPFHPTLSTFHLSSLLSFISFLVVPSHSLRIVAPTQSFFTQFLHDRGRTKAVMSIIGQAQINLLPWLTVFRTIHLRLFHIKNPKFQHFPLVLLFFNLSLSLIFFF